jgi:hypothetical protein
MKMKRTGILSSSISRRSFMQGAAALGGAAGHNQFEIGAAVSVGWNSADMHVFTTKPVASIRSTRGE